MAFASMMFVFIIIICIILSLLFIIGLIFLIAGISSAVIKNIKRADYDNITDRWRNEWVSDHTATDEAIEELLNSADKGDRETFSKTFTPNIQKNENFQALLDYFFELRINETKSNAIFKKFLLIITLN